jgi:CheY-like chemotaxis protein
LRRAKGGYILPGSMSIKCPKCSALIDAAPDELGLVTCGECGARLRSKQQVKVTVAGNPATSSSSPSLPRIDPKLAAPADVDHVLARLDTPSPDQTMRPGALPKLMSAPGGAQAGAVFDMLLTEIRAIKKNQEQILALLSGRPAAGDAGHDPSEAPTQPKAGRAAGKHVVLIVDDDPKARQEAEAALRPLATVKTAADGNSALATIAMEKPDVVVIELAIGGSMPGRDLVNMIKATMEWVDIPILLYTKLPLEDDHAARLEHGADGIVKKGAGSARALGSKVSSVLK